MIGKLKCDQCGSEIELSDDLKAAIRKLLIETDTQQADITKLVTTYQNILKVLDLEGLNGQNIFLKIPKLISTIQRNPERFNFIGPDVLAIIDKYAPK